MLTKFRKKPVVIEAVQWFKMGDHPAVKMTPDYLANGSRGEESPGIETLEGKLRVSVGDWIITGVNGEHYACKPDIFAKTYGPSDRDLLGLRDGSPFTNDELLSAVPEEIIDNKWVQNVIAYLRDGGEAVSEKRKRVCCGHDSDCAVHNEPAMPAGECDCGYTGPDLRFVDGVGGGEEVQEQFGLENKNGKLPEELRPIEVRQVNRMRQGLTRAAEIKEKK